MSAAPVAPAPPQAPSSPLVQAIFSGQAPEPVRLAAARGALPVTRPERLLLCVRLRADAEEAVRQAAEQRLAGEGRADLASALEAGESLATEVLDYYAGRSDLEPQVVEKLVLESGLSDAALEALARCPHPPVLERIVINQTRLLANPALVRLLEANPRLSTTGRRLLLEFKHDFLEKGAHEIVLARAEEPEPAVAQSAPAEAPAQEAPQSGEAELADSRMGELSPEEASDEAFKAAYVRILGMSVPDKVQLALKATREERALLVRDSNRTVAATVLKSPKLSDLEIEQIANMRNVSDEVLRNIATNKNWTRTYSVIYALCRNPKTPAGLALPFLNRLNGRDLKTLIVDKNISEAVRRMTKKVVEQREQANKPPAFKKK